MQNNGRRLFLNSALSLAGAVTLGNCHTGYASTKTAERRLSIKNMHTAERLEVVYWRDGMYLTDATKALSSLMRDHRRNETHEMDVALLDLLHNLHKSVDASNGIELFSGYRSPKTNQALRENNKRVARRSLHMLGKAADIRIPGIRLDIVKSAATSLQSGGVGYYQSSGFIHIDTGRVRHWASR